MTWWYFNSQKLQRIGTIESIRKEKKNRRRMFFIKDVLNCEKIKEILFCVLKFYSKFFGGVGMGFVIMFIVENRFGYLRSNSEWSCLIFHIVLIIPSGKVWIPLVYFCKIAVQTGIFNLGMVSSLSKGNLWIQSCCRPEEGQDLLVYLCWKRIT